MLIVLPPSETKVEGGEGGALDLARLSFPRLTKPRRSLASAVRRLARRPEEMAAALKLGPRLAFEIDRNRALTTSPTMPALQRYTGVLYDALDVASLSPDALGFAASHLAVHSALFGLVGAGDPIPAYRLSHDSRLEPSVKSVWGSSIARELTERPGLVLDLRSEGYVALGPAIGNPDAHYLHVVSEGPNGAKRALNHFNKKGKGEFTRALLAQGEDFASVPDLIEWATASGFRLGLRDDGSLELVV
ncbi:YaaA family protein [Cnuibacter sp. UC19_7]|uniref:YaaA family protein n=1 Tax=Cnuibacter sp. UC19_7 TaxID=3350166 RepID=UPI00366A7655